MAKMISGISRSRRDNVDDGLVAGDEMDDLLSMLRT